MDLQVINERIVGANIERTVLHRDGSVRFRQLNDDSSGWVTVRQLSPFWGRILYGRELRALRAAA